MISADSHGSETDSQNVTDTGEMRLPKILRWFWIGSFGAFALTLLVASFRLLHTAAFFDPANPAPVACPPFGAVQLGLLYFTGHPVIFFVLLALTGLGFAVWGVRRALVEAGIDRRIALLVPVTLALVSFPIQRLVVQGNIEIFLWIFAGAGTWAYLRNRDDVAAISGDWRRPQSSIRWYCFCCFWRGADFVRSQWR